MNDAKNASLLSLKAIVVKKRNIHFASIPKSLDAKRSRDRSITSFIGVLFQNVIEPMHKLTGMLIRLLRFDRFQAVPATAEKK